MSDCGYWMKVTKLATTIGVHPERRKMKTKTKTRVLS